MYCKGGGSKNGSGRGQINFPKTPSTQRTRRRNRVCHPPSRASCELERRGANAHLPSNDVDDDVELLVGEGRLEAVHATSRVILEDRVRAKRLDPIRVLLAAHSCDVELEVRLGELNGDVTHPAAGAEDEDALAGLRDSLLERLRQDMSRIPLILCLSPSMW